VYHGEIRSHPISPEARDHRSIEIASEGVFEPAEK
jgi:hypothetical protein